MPVTKKTAAKPAAKKTAAKPAITKKATSKAAAPSAAKKATAKSAAKKVAPTPEKVGGEITVTGNKILQTLQKEFSKKFEYLIICFIIDEDRGKNVNVKCIDTTKRISEVRKKVSDKEMSLHGRSKVQTIEDFFWKELGIACQIGISKYNGHDYYFPISDTFNNGTLTAANEWAKNSGCAKVTPAVVANACKNLIF